MKIFYKAERDPECPGLVTDITGMGTQHCCVESAKLMQAVEDAGCGVATLSTYKGVVSPRINLANRWETLPTKMCPYCGHIHEAIELED